MHSPTRLDRRSAALLLAILAIAAVVRLWGLGDSPPGLFRDEAEKGYTAYEFLKTMRHGEFVDGAIETTRPLPFFVEVGGVETSAIYQYLTVPFVAVMGLTVRATRMAAALSGLLTVLAVFALARVLVARREEEDWSLLPWFAAAFCALSPTHVLFSRWAQQGITTPLLAAVGIAALLAVDRADPRHRRALSFAGGVALGVCFYAYDPSRLVVPLMLLGLWWELGFRRTRELVRPYAPAAIAFLVLAVPTFLFAITSGGARFARVSVFADQSFGGGLLRAATNYAAHFDPRFLFVWGDANPRHHLPYAGLLAWAESPLFLLGAWSLVRGWRTPGVRLILAWVLAAPAAASLTNEGVPHALRAILFFPAVHLVSAVGACQLARLVNRRAAIASVLVASAASATLLALALGRALPRDGRAYENWQYGVLESLRRMDELAPGARHALSAEVPYAVYFVLFHERTEPEAFQELGGESLRTLIVPPGTRLPSGMWSASPNPNPFVKAGPNDIAPLTGDPGDPAVFVIQRAP